MKDDWVTLWLPGAPRNSKVTTVPLAAFRVGGLKTKLAELPSAVPTRMVVAYAEQKIFVSQEPVNIE